MSVTCTAQCPGEDHRLRWFNYFSQFAFNKRVNPRIIQTSLRFKTELYSLPFTGITVEMNIYLDITSNAPLKTRKIEKAKFSVG